MYNIVGAFNVLPMIPTVFTNGTIGTNDITNITIGKDQKTVGITGITLNAHNVCVQGSTNGTNGIPISFMVLPMVPLVMPLVPMVMVPLATNGYQWYHW